MSAAVAAAICLSWAVAATSLAGEDTFFDTVSREALQRLSPSHHQEAQRQMAPHHEPHLYPWALVLAHPLRIMVITLPWSVFALFTLRPGFAARYPARGRWLLQAMHCWVWPNLLFWSILPEHAPRHSFPLFPGITGLAALVWIQWIRQAQRTTDTQPRTGFRRLVRAPQLLVGILALWLVAKVVFVQVVIPHRNTNREPRAKGQQLAAVVPPGRTLYLFRLKDEGIMFYYGRPVQRLPGPEQLPSCGEPLYCILNEAEWRKWSASGQAEGLLHLRDEQGDPIVLVKMRATKT